VSFSSHLYFWRLTGSFCEVNTQQKLKEWGNKYKRLRCLITTTTAAANRTRKNLTQLSDTLFLKFINLPNVFPQNTCSYVFDLVSESTGREEERWLTAKPLVFLSPKSGIYVPFTWIQEASVTTLCSKHGRNGAITVWIQALRNWQHLLLIPWSPELPKRSLVILTVPCSGGHIFASVLRLRGPLPACHAPTILAIESILN
jgi:hypothetical protein